LVQPEVAESTRVCSYDRAGLGWSDPAQRPRTSQHVADELHRLLTSAGEPGPYLLVGHSLGGHTIRLYTQAHTDEVAGMVLIDPRLDDSSTNPLTNQGRSDSNLAFWGLMSRFGVFRLIGPFVYGPAYQEHMPEHPYGFLLGPTFFETQIMEDEFIAESDRQVQASGSFGDLPLVVITSDIPNMFGALTPEEEPVVAAHIQEGHSRMAGLSTQGRLVVAEGSGHIIPVERPDIVIETILNMVGE
jgi:pimeloyl-ACP methyl ester carboxylesterase